MQNTCITEVAVGYELLVYRDVDNCCDVCSINIIHQKGAKIFRRIFHAITRVIKKSVLKLDINH